ncbi:MAG: hypothetical protein GY826_25385, partial [Fuerstiella sp.]|nr:hypothetical protein [Fuerstiella sp.]
MKQRHVIFGVLFWSAAACCSWYVLRAELTAQSSDVSHLSYDVSRWLSGQHRHLQAVCDERLMVAVGDPVFLQSADGTWRQVGLATDINGEFSRDPFITTATEVLIYEDAITACSDR